MKDTCRSRFAVQVTRLLKAIKMACRAAKNNALIDVDIVSNVNALLWLPKRMKRTNSVSL